MVFRIKRSISIFLERESVREVEQFREQYDPLFRVIPPHVTLVFPFESYLATQECIDHINDTLANKVDQITLEQIGKDGESMVEYTYKLGN